MKIGLLQDQAHQNPTQFHWNSLSIAVGAYPPDAGFVVSCQKAQNKQAALGNPVPVCRHAPSRNEMGPIKESICSAVVDGIYLISI